MGCELLTSAGVGTHWEIWLVWLRDGACVRSQESQLFRRLVTL